MKTKYVQPQTEVLEVEAENMLALSLGNEQADPEEDVLVNKRRGTWGDFWVK